MSFIDKLDELMKEKHINKSTLSKEADIPYTTIDGFYKKGSDNIKLSTLKKISTYFNCTLDYLVDDDSQTNEQRLLAAHFDGKEYTEDELGEIQRYAEFVKNRRKS